MEARVLWTAATEMTSRFNSLARQSLKTAKRLHSTMSHRY